MTEHGLEGCPAATLGRWAAGLLMAGALCPLPALAAGGAPFAFLRLDSSGRPAALGGAYSALAADSNALHYNPAGLAWIKTHELSLLHNNHFQGVSHQAGGLALRQGFGLQFKTAGYRSLQRTTLSNPSGDGLGSFSARDLAVGAGYGRRVAGRLGLGMGLKHLSSTIDAYSASAFALDMGALYRPERLKGLSLGAALQNLGGRVRFQSAWEELPLTLRLAGAYECQIEGRQALLTLDVDQARGGEARVSAGAEVRIAGRLALRLGYDGRNDAGPGIAAGLGFELDRFAADYAFSPYGELGSSHRFSLTLHWGKGGEGAQARGQAGGER
ncbi:MAG: PorV/PorQ family protein [Elusimicrobia bacterium]|nr:PorV/PorQ family protein [Elusimicrobiota bacterium]